LHKGDVFAMYCPNLPEYAVAVHGVVMLGGVVTTANPLYTANELAYQLDDADATCILTVPAFLDKAKEAVAKTGVREIFVIGEAPGATPFPETAPGHGTCPRSTSTRVGTSPSPYSTARWTAEGRDADALQPHRSAPADRALPPDR
jgi:acyl-CoA synthetase (AMP-forming)/AMP-acid ligase II